MKETQKKRGKTKKSTAVVASPSNAIVKRTNTTPARLEKGKFSEEKGVYCVRNIELAEEGRELISWAESRMPVLMSLRKEMRKTKPLKGIRIAGCLHVTKETAVLIRAFQDAGAIVSWSGCNPLSTNDAVSAALAVDGISIYAWYGCNVPDFYWSIERTLDMKPHLTLDDGCDLINTVHEKYQHMLVNISSVVLKKQQPVYTDYVHVLRKVNFFILFMLLMTLKQNGILTTFTVRDKVLLMAL